MTVSPPSNIFQTVQTYQEGELAYLQNYACFINTFNTRFKNFQNEIANLGSAITFSVPPQSFAINNLVTTFETSQQLVQTLTVDQQYSVARAITAQQLIFNNMQAYMEEFGKADIMGLATKIEGLIALNAISAMPAPLNGLGAVHTESGPARFFGNGTNEINSYGQIAQMFANYRELGFANELKFYIPAVKVPGIINSGLNQFVLKRNEEISQSWMLGTFDDVHFYRTNVMPVHAAGTVGNGAQLLTVVSTNDPTGANITQITASGATPNDANAIKAGDVGQFNFNVSGQPNIYALTYYGQIVTGQPVQFRVTEDAAADNSGNVVINITYTGSAGLNATVSQGQNISGNVLAGMQFIIMPTHRAGLLIDGNGGYLAMPKMPDMTPYPYANKVDERTGATLRSYYGAIPFQNQYGYVHDGLMGATIVPQWSMRVLFPITS